MTIDVRDFGTVDVSGAAESTTACQAALDAADAAGGGVVQFPAGTILLGQLTIGSETWIRGLGAATTIKMKNALNLPLLTNKNTSSGNVGITIADLTIDGNKANQTSGLEGTGIKLIKVDRLEVANLWIDNTEGHGLHLSSVTSTDEGPRISNVLITNAGSGPNNTFGSCFGGTEVEDAVLTNVQCYDSAKAGFRLSGSYTLNGCIARRNGNGGLVAVASELMVVTINGGVFSDNGPNSNNEGIRLVNTDRATLNGVVCENNYSSGVIVLNGCDNVTINGGVFRNNGQSASAPSATEGRDGISVKNDAGSGNSNTNVNITGTVLSGNSQYGISVQNTADNVVIGSYVAASNGLGSLLVSSAGNVVVQPTIAERGHGTPARVESLLRNEATTMTALANGTVQFSFVTPDQDLTISNLLICSGSTAQSGATLVRLGLYTIASNGDLTLAARTANDTSILSAASMLYTVPLDTAGGYPSSFLMARGVRYAFAAVVVGATTSPTVRAQNLTSALYGINPVMARARTAQTDLPTSATAGAAGVSGNIYWMAGS